MRMGSLPPGLTQAWTLASVESAVIVMVVVWTRFSIARKRLAARLVGVGSDQDLPLASTRAEQRGAPLLHCFAEVLMR